ncbi:MAG: hypothetical protein EBT45_09180, partial [Alphaproteobacteria bacterium]|nr:hypothetical protein [Alphaproteobacteria bacterium]
SAASHLAPPRETKGLQTDAIRGAPFLGSKDQTGPEVSKSFVSESVVPYSEDRRESFLPLENPKGHAEKKTVSSSSQQGTSQQHGYGFRGDSSLLQERSALIPDIPTEPKQVIRGTRDIKPNLTDTTASSDSRVKQTEQMKESADKLNPDGLNPQRVEALKAEVSALQSTGTKSIEMAEKQHEQQRQGIEKEVHKKGKKNLLRVATKVELKNLGDTVVAPFEGIGDLVKKLRGESQKKP